MIIDITKVIRTQVSGGWYKIKKIDSMIACLVLGELFGPEAIGLEKLTCDIQTIPVLLLKRQFCLVSSVFAKTSLLPRYVRFRTYVNCLVCAATKVILWSCDFVWWRTTSFEYFMFCWFQAIMSAKVKITEMSGRGLGLLAVNDITAGDLILRGLSKLMKLESSLSPSNVKLCLFGQS